MATGDQADFVRRLKAVLPNGWYGDETPILDPVLNGLAWGWAQVYALLQFVRRQSRIATATDIWLDLAATDYFGRTMTRRLTESDALFRARIMARMFRMAVTREGILAGLLALTGRNALIIEPWSTGDCGAYAGAGNAAGGRMAWNTAGAWGSLQLPYQFFVQAKRPNSGGIAGVQGLSTQPQMVGGWGVGAIEWVSPAMNPGQIGDAEIYQTIVDLKPEGTIGWTNISS